MKYAVCISNDGYPVALIMRRIYCLLPDDEARKHGMVRVVDESGEDYLYPAGMFTPVDLPQSLEKLFTVTSRMSAEAMRRRFPSTQSSKRAEGSASVLTL